MNKSEDDKYCNECNVLLTPWESFGPMHMEISPNVFTCMKCLEGKEPETGEALMKRRT